MSIFNKKRFGTGAIPEPDDIRDLSYEDVVFGTPEVDWKKGYDVENELGINIPIKAQNGSSSCVGQGVSYYTAILNCVEIGKYQEVSAKAIYSQIHLINGGAYIRDGVKLIKNWGAVKEEIVPSYKNGKPPKEKFMKDESWKNEKLDKLAKILQAKEYRKITGKISMNLLAHAIQNNFGAVSGVWGSNNGTWRSLEPKPPVDGHEWGHLMYFGKFGIDRYGKYVSSPNSWGNLGKDELHPDGWQKLREDYFDNKYMFNPWILVDKPNYSMSDKTKTLMQRFEKRVIIEGEGIGRKGIIINGELRPISKDRVAEACLYVLANHDYGTTVSSQVFNEMKKGNKF